MSISVCLAAKLIINPQHPATNFTDMSINITPIGPNGPARPTGHLAKAANSPAKRRLRHAKTPLPAKRKAASAPSPAPGAGKAKPHFHIMTADNSIIFRKCKQNSVVISLLYLDFVYIYTKYFIVSRLTALVADCFFGSKPESLPLHM